MTQTGEQTEQQAGQVVTVRLPADVYRWLRGESYRRDLGMNQLVVQAVERLRQESERQTGARMADAAEHPVSVIGSWSRSSAETVCERCGHLSTRHLRVYHAPYDPLTQPHRTPTHWWCIPCSQEMEAISYHAYAAQREQLRREADTNGGVHEQPQT